MIERIEHHYHLLDVAHPFQGKPRISSFLITLFDECQELEDFLHALQAVVDLNTTTHLPTLQRLAALVGQDVTTTDPEELRSLIKARIAINVSTGHRNDLVAVLFAMGWDDEARFPGAHWRWQRFQGGVELLIGYDDGSPTDPWLVATRDLLNEAAASGLLVRVLFDSPGGSLAFGGSGAGVGSEAFAEIV